MNPILYAVLSLLAISGSLEMAVAGGKTGACTKPTGTITCAPDQKCSGANVIAMGKQITFTATNLKDKDCNCGKAVWDTITETNIQWHIEVSGSSAEATGSSATWTAAAKVVSGVKLSLKVQDDGTATGTTKDFSSPTEIATGTVNVVIPNHVDTTEKSTGCTSDYGGSYGKALILTDTVSKNSCSVDFSGLNIAELSGEDDPIDACKLGPSNIGTPWNTLDAANKAKDDDRHSICSDSDSVVPNCSTWSVTKWYIRDPQYTESSETLIFSRTYTETSNSDGKISTMKLARSVSYP